MMSVNNIGMPTVGAAIAKVTEMSDMHSVLIGGLTGEHKWLALTSLMTVHYDDFIIAMCTVFHVKRKSLVPHDVFTNDVCLTHSIPR